MAIMIRRGACGPYVETKGVKDLRRMEGDTIYMTDAEASKLIGLLHGILARRASRARRFRSTLKGGR